MSNKIPKFASAIPANIRGKIAFFPNIGRTSSTEDYQAVNKKIINTYDKFLKLNQLDQTLEYNYPQYFTRLNEQPKPCDIRRQKKEDKIRAKDRADVKFMCDWFMWTQAAYKPPKKNKK